MQARQITSSQNPLIKLVKSIHKPRNRKKHRLVKVEGIRETRQAMAAGHTLKYVFFSDKYARSEEVQSLLAESVPTEDILEVSDVIFSTLVYRQKVPNVLALFQLPEVSLAHISLPANPLVMVLESVEKPGNLGAILRTCDAAGVDLLLVCNPKTDIYHPNVIRSGLGCVFTVPTVACSNKEALNFLRAANIQVIAATDQGATLYYDIDYKRPTAIVMGTEADGLTEFWLNAASSAARIPMSGKIDSLNVSNAAAIFAYEAIRQRQNLQP